MDCVSFETIGFVNFSKTLGLGGEGFVSGVVDLEFPKFAQGLTFVSGEETVGVVDGGANA